MKRAPLSLKAQALALLARREHSRAELRTKLLAHARKRAAHDAAEASGTPSADAGHNGWGSGWEGDPFGESATSAPPVDPAHRVEPDPDALAAEVDEVLDWLQAQRYQSDERFVESRLNSRAPRLGLTRIRQELSRHGVELDSDTVRTLRQSEVRAPGSGASASASRRPTCASGHVRCASWRPGASAARWCARCWGRRTAD
jgi:regulatory protein